VSGSTLHLARDIFVSLGGPGTAVYIDAHAYPILRWGAEWAALRGARLQVTPAHDVAQLKATMTEGAVRSPVSAIVTDGYCAVCGRVPPLAAYLEVARQHGAALVVDDTQALGILGDRPGSEAPYGTGGGGSARYHALSGPGLLVVASLAKGFGVPMAIAAGDRALVAKLRADGETRYHCSPPSLATLGAASHALAVNRASGDPLRGRLVAIVRQFRGPLLAAGARLVPGLFPIQWLRAPQGRAAAHLSEQLRTKGIRVLLTADRSTGLARLTFLLTARHTTHDIDTAASTLTHALAHLPRGGFHDDPTGGRTITRHRAHPQRRSSESR